ncbi:M48 family metallopeptidase [Streptosporangium sp. NPDC051023]|uniref:M48 family metallopeptidase n=1 Tax=Streptosporangium sp. NPDC051023 TaxID=3155410 RepID=UPI00344B7050
MILLRALLALGLLVGLYTLCLVLVLVDLGAIALLVQDSVSLGKPLPTGAVMMALTTVPALWVLRGLFAFGVWHEPDPQAVSVTPGQAPALWAVVRQLAEEVGTRPPASIWLTGEVNAAVTEETSLLGLVGGTRRLYVGLPLLAGLSADELRAVLCHELGHYAHAHTRLGAITYRGHLALRATLDRLERSRRPLPGARGRRQGVPSSWIWWPFLGYAFVYFRLSSAVNRRQELQADAAAAGIVGAEVAAEALWRSLAVLPGAWEEFRSRYLDPMHARGCVPDDPLAVFATMLAAPGYRGRIEELRGLPPSRSVSRYDSHPSLARRLEALGLPEGPTVERDQAPGAGRDRVPAAESLGPGPGPQAVQRCLFPAASTRLATLPWGEWVELTAETRATEPARRLVRAARRVGGTTRPALATVLDLLARGRGRRLAAHFADPLATEEDEDLDGRVVRLPGTPGGQEATAALPRLDAALFALVGQALVTRGRAHWEMTWTGENRLAWSRSGALAAAGVTVEEIRVLVTAAVVGGITEVGRLRLHLGSLGVDPETWLGQDAEGTRQAEEPVETMSVSPAADVEELRENRRQLQIRLAGAVLIGGLFLVTSLPSLLGREPAYSPGVRVDVRPVTPYVTPWRAVTPVPVSPYPSIPPAQWLPSTSSRRDPLTGRPRDVLPGSRRLKDLLKDGRSGYRVDPGDVEKLLVGRKRR